MKTHPLDKALDLVHSDIQAGCFTGATSPDYWNMVGPFGGTTAAVMLQAVLRHPDLLGEPVAVTVNYAAAVGEGAFEILAVPVRTNRSTQHWTIQMSQAGADGKPQVTTTGTAVTAVRRETWGTSDLPMPEAPPPAAVERATSGRPGPPGWAATRCARSSDRSRPNGTAAATPARRACGSATPSPGRWTSRR